VSSRERISPKIIGNLGHALKNFRQPWARPKIGFKGRQIISLPGTPMSRADPGDNKTVANLRFMLKRQSNP